MLCFFSESQRIVYRRICICGKCEKEDHTIIREGKEEIIIEQSSDIPGNLERCAACGGNETYYIRESQFCDQREDCPYGEDEEEELCRSKFWSKSSSFAPQLVSPRLFHPFISSTLRLGDKIFV